MNKIRLTELSQAVQDFLGQVLAGDGVEIEDESGRIRGGFIPYRDPTAAEIERADASLERLRKKTGEGMKRAGVTEDDIDRVLQEDD